MKASNDLSAMGCPEEVEDLYTHMLTELRSAIELKFGTLADFVRAAAKDGYHFEQMNLYRKFKPERPDKMSLEMYVRLCAACGIGGDRIKNMRLGSSNISLLDYLMVDNDAIMKTLLAMQYQNDSAKLKALKAKEALS